MFTVFWFRKLTHEESKILETIQLLEPGRVCQVVIKTSLRLYFGRT